MSKGLKEALTVLIVTHVTHKSFTVPSNAIYVEGVRSYFDF